METITSVKNERVKAAAKLWSSAKARREQGLFVLEGLRLCMDVVRSDLRCAELFVSEEFCEKHAAEFEALSAVSDEVFLVNDAVLEKLSDTRTPQGVCAVVRMPAGGGEGEWLTVTAATGGGARGVRRQKRIPVRSPAESRAGHPVSGSEEDTADNPLS